MNRTEVAVVGAPFSKGQRKAGTERAPFQIRAAGLVRRIEDLGYKVEDVGDVSIHLEAEGDSLDGKVRNPRAVAAVSRALQNAVAAQAAAGRFTLTLGGDHSIAIGTISGLMQVRPDTCVVWIDAHADINTPSTTMSGNMHGMPLSLLVGLAGEIPGFEWLKPCLAFDRLVYIGLRDVDPGEKEILRQHRIRAFSMTDVDRYGIHHVLDLALDAVNPERNRPIHLSFDIDGLDPIHAPATGTAVRGGLTLREGRCVCEYLASTNLLKSMDLVEINPVLGNEKEAAETVESGIIMVESALGRRLL